MSYGVAMCTATSCTCNSRNQANISMYTTVVVDIEFLKYMYFVVSVQGECCICIVRNMVDYGNLDLRENGRENIN